MTNGTSQGLFIIVAIIIFGIFIAIGYLLFRDTLKPSLSTIFTDSLEQ
ncbi:TPA: leucine-rich repeat domain-containing protein, partial [Enterococcus faecalis]|nr:leucine-rich repeat domain-containing protein [Enterococcus faecalis]